jgi:large subunit ribosomal protein L17
LGRDLKERKALLNNLASSVIVEEKITTTLAKAKFAKPFIEKLVTTAKKGALYHRRTISSLLSPKAFAKLINEIAPGFARRTGGYTRITRLAQRRGDNAPMVRLEFLGWDKKAVAASSEKKKKVPVASVIKNQRKSAKNPPKSKS